MEIERKWVLCLNPTDMWDSESVINDILSKLSYIETHGTIISQWYIKQDDESETRFRKMIDCRSSEPSYWITKKSGHGLSREENEIQLPQDLGNGIYNALSFCDKYNVVLKTRRSFKINDEMTAEIDVYGDALFGLVTMEIEFKKFSDATLFNLIDVETYTSGVSIITDKVFRLINMVAREVTDDEIFSNSNLSQSLIAEQTNGKYALIKK